MDLIAAMTGPFLGVIGASIVMVLFAAMLLGLAVGSVFFAIFYISNHLGKAASRAYSEPGA